MKQTVKVLFENANAVPVGAELEVEGVTEDGVYALHVVNGQAVYVRTGDLPPAPVVEFTVTFDSDGGSAVSAETVEEGELATEPADPTKADNTFLGWFLGETEYNFATPVTGNITLLAHWQAA